MVIFTFYNFQCAFFLSFHLVLQQPFESNIFMFYILQISLLKLKKAKIFHQDHT